MSTPLMDNLVRELKAKGLSQTWLADKLATHPTHLNKIIKGKAAITKTMAKKISNLKEIDITEHELMYPSQPLSIVGQYFTGNSVEKYEIDRPSVLLPNPILPTWFGVLHRGNQQKQDIFYCKKEDSYVEIYDSYFQKNNFIDERAIGNSALICTIDNVWISCRLGEYDKNYGYQYWYHYNATTHYSELKWASIIMGATNLKAMNQEFELDFL